MSHPIADLLTRIRNANALSYKQVSIPVSKLKVKILEVMTKEGFIRGFQLDPKKANIIVQLKYTPEKEKAISGLKRVSRYVSVAKIPRVLNGLGVALISTSKGILTDYEASKQNIGGEVLAYIW